MTRMVRTTAIALAGLLILTACGEGADPRAATDDPSQQETAADGEGDEESGDTVELVIESWRPEDLAMWEDTILPVFEEANPGIEVTFSPTGATEYNAAVESKLQGGTAGDLITCRPFDLALAQFDAGHLAPLDDLDGMEHFSDVARLAWTTDDGETTYCVPVASVLHGFIYNQDIFDELGLTAPETEDEFFAALDAVREDGTYEPLAIGTADEWVTSTMGYTNVGPNFWQGEEGRLGLIDGSMSYTDEPFVAAFEHMDRWRPYLPDGYESVNASDAQNLFTLGRAAVYPAGSWDIALFNEQAGFEMGAFAPPVPAGTDGCYISDYPDMAMGVNTASPHAEEARVFLEWLTTPEFGTLYANALPGFYPMSDHEIEVDDALAQEFLSWRGACDSTIRVNNHILTRGEPNPENALRNAMVQLLNGNSSPQDAATSVDEALSSWYEPQQ